MPPCTALPEHCSACLACSVLDSGICVMAPKQSHLLLLSLLKPRCTHSPCFFLCRVHAVCHPHSLVLSTLAVHICLHWHSLTSYIISHGLRLMLTDPPSHGRVTGVYL